MGLPPSTSMCKSLATSDHRSLLTHDIPNIVPAPASAHYPPQALVPDPEYMGVVDVSRALPQSSMNLRQHRVC